MKIRETITMMFISGFVSAETDSFRPGNLLQWLINVLGFNLIDTSTALPEFLAVIFLIALVYMILRKVKT